MNVLLLGCGSQGKAALYDLIRNKDIKKIFVVERGQKIKLFIDGLGDKRVRLRRTDAKSKRRMLGLMKKVDVIIDLLPTEFRARIAKLAVISGTDLVNTSYRHHLHELSGQKKITLLPEMGLDPGIDLVLAGHAIRQLDKVISFSSACGGIPAKDAADNPIKYKVSWTFDGVLDAYMRAGDVIVDGKLTKIFAGKAFDYNKPITITGIGKLDCYPNGHASVYARLLGIHKTVVQMGRYTLRWAGHCDFWKKIIKLGLLDDDPVDGVSPRRFLAKVLGPRLQYGVHEHDLVVLRNEFVGYKGKMKVKIIQRLIDRRDMKTGFFAMNRTVGFTASIAAQMILDGRIKKKGILNPAKDVPYGEFMSELRMRGIEISWRIKH